MIPSGYYLNCPGAQVTRLEREFIKTCAQGYGNMLHPVFVNIGIMWGCTVHCLRAGHPTADITALDIKDAWEVKYRDDLNVNWVWADSRTYQFKRPIDLLLIDGDHHYETISRDIKNWCPHVTGIVMFHDFKPTPHNLRQFPELADVRRAVTEFVKHNRGLWKKVGTADSIIAYRRL